MRSVHLILLPLLLLACSDQQPAAPNLTASPMFDASANAAGQVWEEFSRPGYNVCVDVVDFTGAIHVTWRRILNDPGKMSHYVYTTSVHASGVGQNTGYIWKGNQHFVQQNQWDTDGAPDKWMFYNTNMTFVGQGGAPDFRSKILIHSTVNANGVPVQFNINFDPLCP